MHNKLIAVFIGLTLLFGGGTAGAGESKAGPQPAKVKKQVAGTEGKSTKEQSNERQSGHYPPYPNVWGYEFSLPEGSQTRALQISVHKAQDGDYAVNYVESVRVGSNNVYTDKGIYFFSGKRVSQSSLTRYFKEKVSGNTALRKEIRFDGKTSWETDTNCLVCCPYLSQHPLTKYSPTRTNEQLSVIYFSEQPVRLYYTKPFDKCLGKGAWQKFTNDFYYTQVFETIPYLVPLKDSTFLLYDSIGNFIIRLDKNFNSKSDLLNKKVFIVNAADINAIENGLFDADLFNRQTYDNTVTLYIKALRNGLQRDAALKEALNNINIIKREGKTNGN
jgi:hypothetical protein